MSANDAADQQTAYENGYEDGAAVAFGLMGMARAIRINDYKRRLREEALAWATDVDAPEPCIHCGRVMLAGLCCAAAQRHGTGETK